MCFIATRTHTHAQTHTAPQDPQLRAEQELSTVSKLPREGRMFTRRFSTRNVVKSETEPCRLVTGLLRISMTTRAQEKVRDRACLHTRNQIAISSRLKIPNNFPSLSLFQIMIRCKNPPPTHNRTLT